MSGPMSPALASPSKLTVLRYSHSFEVAVSFLDGSAFDQKCSCQHAKAQLFLQQHSLRLECCGRGTA